MKKPSRWQVKKRNSWGGKVKEQSHTSQNSGNWSQRSTPIIQLLKKKKTRSVTQTKTRSHNMVFWRCAYMKFGTQPASRSLGRFGWCLRSRRLSVPSPKPSYHMPLPMARGRKRIAAYPPWRWHHVSRAWSDCPSQTITSCSVLPFFSWDAATNETQNVWWMPWQHPSRVWKSTPVQHVTSRCPDRCPAHLQHDRHTCHCHVRRHLFQDHDYSPPQKHTGVGLVDICWRFWGKWLGWLWGGPSVSDYRRIWVICRCPSVCPFHVATNPWCPYLRHKHFPVQARQKKTRVSTYLLTAATQSTSTLHRASNDNSGLLVPEFVLRGRRWPMKPPWLRDSMFHDTHVLVLAACTSHSVEHAQCLPLHERSEGRRSTSLVHRDVPLHTFTMAYFCFCYQKWQLTMAGSACARTDIQTSSSHVRFRCASHCIGPCTILCQRQVWENHFVGGCAAFRLPSCTCKHVVRISFASARCRESCHMGAHYVVGKTARGPVAPSRWRAWRWRTFRSADDCDAQHWWFHPCSGTAQAESCPPEARINLAVNVARGKMEKQAEDSFT